MKPSFKLKLPRHPAVFDQAADFLNTRTPREKMLIVAFGGVLILCIDLAVWLLPVVHKFSETLPKMSAVGIELKGLKQDVQNRDAIQKRWESVSGDLEAGEKALIDSDQIPAMLEDLSKNAQRSSVKITSLKPVETVAASGRKHYQPVRIQMNALAGTHELGAFLSKLEAGAAFFRVVDLKISSNPSDERRHLVELLLETGRKS